VAQPYIVNHSGSDQKLRTLFHILIAVSIFTAAGCAGESTVGVGHSGVGYSKSSAEPVDLSGIEVRRIGNDQVRLREFQDRAIANSIAHLQSQGIERERIKSVTVDTIGGESSGSLTIGTSARYMVWVKVDGCEKDVMYNAGPTGQVSTPRDSGACLQTSQ
jgi:hypothetical protein